MENLLCNENESLFSVLEVMHKGGKKIVFIVDDDNRLKNVLTDGDIRELLIAGHKLSEKVSNFLKKKFVYAREDEKQSKIIAKLNEKIKIVPIVDKKMRIIDYAQLDKDVHMPIAAPNLAGKELTYLIDAFLSTWISSTGKYIENFEKEFSKFCGTKYAVAVSNGTVALHLALTVLGIKEGDEVIVPDLTFAATINAVLHTKATPVIVDIEKDYWTINPEEIEKAITAKTKAIVPVHLYGQPCNMKQIMDIAKKYNLFVIEDCAEAHGAEFNNKKVGSFGNVGCFSFFANKIITTGEGGMCVMNNKTIYEKMRVLRDHGMSKTKKYWHTQIGFNYRMTNLQAAIGYAQLERIEQILKTRQDVEYKYRDILKNVKFLEFQKMQMDRKKVTWLVSVLIKNKKRNFYLKKLLADKIDARPFFYSLGSMPIYKKYLFSNKNSLQISKQGLNFPTGIDIKEADIQKIKKYL